MNDENKNTFALFEEAASDREVFWENQAKGLHWFSPWEKVLEWSPPYAK